MENSIEFPTFPHDKQQQIDFIKNKYLTLTYSLS